MKNSDRDDIVFYIIIVIAILVYGIIPHSLLQLVVQVGIVLIGGFIWIVLVPRFQKWLKGRRTNV